MMIREIGKMNSNWIKKYYKVILLNIIILLVILNIFGIFLMDQKLFPQISKNLQHAPVGSYIIPDTKSYKSEDVLFVGDSYTQGSGDGYMTGEYNYSIAHMYSKFYKLNVHNAGKGGYGNIRSVRNAIWLDKILDKSPFYNKFPKFNKIIFFFYEGNDLNNYINETSKFNNPKSYEEYLSISKPSEVEVLMHSYLPGAYVILKLIPRIYAKIKSFAFPYYNNINISKQDKVKNVIETKNGTWSTGRLQAAAVELKNLEVDKAILGFEDSLLVLKKYFNVDNIEIVYLPSVATVYDNILNTIHIESYVGLKNKVNKNENKARSLYIRNKIEKMSAINNFKFVDTTDYLRKEGKNRPIHGPLDNKHLNLYGYKKVFDFIVQNN